LDITDISVFHDFCWYGWNKISVDVETDLPDGTEVTFDIDRKECEWVWWPCGHWECNFEDVETGTGTVSGGEASWTSDCSKKYDSETCYRVTVTANSESDTDYYHCVA
jgi:hypothetical protein